MDNQFARPRSSSLGPLFEYVADERDYAGCYACALVVPPSLAGGPVVAMIVACIGGLIGRFCCASTCEELALPEISLAEDAAGWSVSRRDPCTKLLASLSSTLVCASHSSFALDSSRALASPSTCTARCGSVK